MRKLVYIHGLPGAGKTTLARAVCDVAADSLFVDLGAHPNFRKSRSYEIVSSEYFRVDPQPAVLVFEGVTSRRSARDRLISQVLSVIKMRTPSLTDPRVAIFYLATPPSVLATRRNRSVAEYEALLAEVEPGSDEFQYFIIDPTLFGLDQQVRSVLDFIEWE